MFLNEQRFSETFSLKGLKEPERESKRESKRTFLKRITDFIWSEESGPVSSLEDAHRLRPIRWACCLAAGGHEAGDEASQWSPFWTKIMSAYRPGEIMPVRMNAKIIQNLDFAN